MAERSISKAVSCAVRITLLGRKARRMFPRLVEEYRGARDRYSSFEYWKSVFE